MIKTSLGVKRYNNKMQKTFNTAIYHLQLNCPHPKYFKDDNNKIVCEKCGKEQLTNQNA